MQRRSEILAFLKSNGPSTLDAVAAQLGVTRQGALRHLDALTRDGLVRSDVESDRHRGRPRHLFQLTAAAADSFPQDHRILATELVHFLDASQLQRFFADRAARIEREYAERLEGISGRARVEELARIATEKGHMASVVELDDGSVAIRHCHCPIGDVAIETRHACREEQEMYSRLLGQAVERTSSMPEAPACTYVVTGSSPGRTKKSSRSQRLAAAN